MENSSADSRAENLAPVGGDSFARIGQGSAGGKEALVEPQPDVLPDIDLPIAAGGCLPGFLPRAGRETTGDFRAGLKALEERAAPFLQCLAPPLPSHRTRFPVKKARWRLATPDDLADGAAVLDGRGEWSSVALPHYGGPIGRATAFYRCEVDLPDELFSRDRLFLCFRGADYRAQVFLNGTFLCEHEGFFDPFEAEVTRVAKPGRNVLTVRLDNDAILMGNNPWGQPEDGEKIYAATGLGWDEPGLGWHHCPPGMGLYQEVFFEARAALHVHEVWVRPVPHEKAVEIHAVIRNAGAKSLKLGFALSLFGKNFEGTVIRDFIPDALPEAGSGLSRYRVSLPLPHFRWWHPDHPWLYEAHLAVRDGAGRIVDTLKTTFGVRTFQVSEEGPEKGRLFLNGEEIRLRGANTMGHEQQCVFKGDLAQLREDILIAKQAGLNFLRLTQRPVQSEIYEACDRLGMMVQSDLPLFGKVRSTQFAEGVRQAGAMERLIRSHPSCVLTSLINEPFPLSWGDTTHRHMKRSELEAFLRACGEIVRFENPDRQIKPVDGDYDAPAPGLPDNHCYCGWYAGHALPLGKLHRGHWVPVKPGWRYACGEFGAEGLDPADLMRRHYPEAWLPGAEGEAAWSPLRISHAQTGRMHGLWIDAGRTMEEWVRASQEHQAWATRLMTRAFRRDRRMVSCAIHLLIDAFPAGWMKAVVDFERNPKPAFFEYRAAMAPLLVDARLDRWAWWGGESFAAEAWICHDGQKGFEGFGGVRLRYLLETDEGVLASGETLVSVPRCDSAFAGMIRFRLPEVGRRTEARLRLGLVAADGAVLNQTEETLSIFPAGTGARGRPSLRLMSEDMGAARRLLEELGLPFSTLGVPGAGEVIVADRSEAVAPALSAVRAGATLVLLELPPGSFEIDGETVAVEAAGYGPRDFVSRATGHPLVAGFGRNDFRFWFDEACDYASPLLDTLFVAEGWTPILSTTQAGWAQEPRDALACAEKRVGKGRILLCQVKLAGRTRNVPPAALFARRLLEWESERNRSAS